ncbi:MAG: hypothetical protein ACFB21_11330 [Opitutales bacterium]
MMPTTRLFLLPSTAAAVTLLTLMNGCAPGGPRAGPPASDAIEPWVDYAQRAHNIESWWTKDLVSAEVVVDFQGSRIVDGTFIFEAHGPRARYERADGATIIFEGETAYITPADAEDQQGRFHVLTWPWFLMAPFKMQGEGIELSDFARKQVANEEYVTIFQTFAGDMGDTPDDWYRYFIDPESGLVYGMSYIVTYGKSEDEANEQASMIRYFDYIEGDGPIISQRQEYWYWDKANAQLSGDGPKGTSNVTNIEYFQLDESLFEIPENSRELPLPGGSEG